MGIQSTADIAKKLFIVGLMFGATILIPFAGIGTATATSPVSSYPADSSYPAGSSYPADPSWPSPPSWGSYPAESSYGGR